MRISVFFRTDPLEVKHFAITNRRCLRTSPQSTDQQLKCAKLRFDTRTQRKWGEKLTNWMLHSRKHRNREFLSCNALRAFVDVVVRLLLRAFSCFEFDYFLFLIEISLIVERNDLRRETSIRPANSAFFHFSAF